jgi:hypothetical protein
MRRGTIGFFGQELPPLLPTFRHACRFRPDVLGLIFRTLQARGFPLPDQLDTAVELYNGDLLDGGRGEILLRA